MGDMEIHGENALWRARPAAWTWQPPKAAGEVREER